MQNFDLRTNPLRDEIIYRPALAFAIGLILGIAAIENLVAALLLATFLLLVRHGKTVAIAAAGFALGAVLAPRQPAPLLQPTWIDGTAAVVSVPRLYPSQSTCQVQAGNLRLSMAVPRDQGLSLQDRIHLRGLAKPLPEGADRLLRRGIVGSIRPVSIVVDQPGPWIFRAGVTWRDSFARFCERWLPPQAAAAAEAVCFNVDTALDDETKDSLSRSGTVHIVSASGLHVAVLAVALMWLLSRVPIPRNWQLVGLAAFLAMYAVASGLHAPVIRAALMALVLCSAYLFRREPDLLSALAFAAVANLIWDPSAMQDPGFQLSFTVVGAFSLFRIHRRPSPPHSFQRLQDAAWSGLRQTGLASAAAAPLVAYSFGTLSLTSIAANLLLAFSIPVLVVGAMGAHLLNFVLPSVATGIMVAVVGPMCGWLFFVTDSLGKPWAALTVPEFSGYWVLLAYGLMLSVWSVRLRPA